MLRNIIIDYGATSEMSAYDYMKNYVEKCPKSTEDSKISWIVDSFLGIQKHEEFLKKITLHMSEELTEEDQDYFMITFYAITFQITPADTHCLYKSLFNLSKSLLHTFTNFLSNNEVLTFITQLATSKYDTNFVTQKIIGPIFTWQPYISEMGHTYGEYLKKLESRKTKLPTIPVQLNVLNRKMKESTSATSAIAPRTPPNSIQSKAKKMLTKSAIDEKLQILHNKNKQKAMQLLNLVKNKNYTKVHSIKTKNVKNEIDINKPFKSRINIPSSDSTPVVKYTTASIKRINRSIQQTEQKEVKWLQDLMVNCTNTAKINELLEYDRQETERERLLDIERKHLMGQISYEEAVIAKKKVYDENKKKYEEFLKEKQIWEEEIELWKSEQIEKNRKQVEKLSFIELDMLHAKKNAIMKKQQVAEEVRKESEDMLAIAMKKKQEEFERKIKMIKEIKILAMIAKKAKVPKVIDLTESSGTGLLCEMSIAELQERLSIVKIGLKEDLEERKRQIKEAKRTAKRHIDEAKDSIQNYMEDRAKLRQQSRKPKQKVKIVSSNEIDELKKILEEKKNLRKQLTN